MTQTMPDKKEWNRPAGAVAVFSIFQERLKHHRFDLSGKTVLNIGTGNLIGLDLLFLLHGAERVISLDLDPGDYQYPQIATQLPFYEELWNLITDRGKVGDSFWPDSIITHTNGSARLNSKRLTRLAPADVCRLPLPDACIDFAFSNAVMEHVSDPGAAVAQIGRVLAPGGHTMHRVDLRDHADFSQPLEFLKPGRPTHGCNLWRADHYRDAFEKGPLTIEEFEVFDLGSVSPAERATFLPEFAALSCEELARYRFMVYAVKP